jgi:hypothetical protein
VPCPFCARVSPVEAYRGAGAASAVDDESRKVDRLHHLSVDDAEFVDAVFERIIPEVGASGPSGAAAAYVDHKLDELARADAGTGRCVASRVTHYQSGIAAVQAHCVATYGSRFQHLPARNQLVVLSALEECGERATDPHAPFFHVLVNDAAESYFDGAMKQGNERFRDSSARDALVAS